MTLSIQSCCSRIKKQDYTALTDETNNNPNKSNFFLDQFISCCASSRQSKKKPFGTIDDLKKKHPHPHDTSNKQAWSHLSNYVSTANNKLSMTESKGYSILSEFGKKERISLFERVKDAKSSKFYTQHAYTKKIPSAFICPISKKIMKKPVIAGDGYTYEQSALLMLFAGDKCISPMTKQPFTNFSTYKNTNLIDQIKLLKSHSNPSANNKSFLCPISGHIMSDPVFSCDDYCTYDRCSLIKWFKGNKSAKSPQNPSIVICRSRLKENKALKEQILKHLSVLRETRAIL